jgi:hypothetical protein
MLLILGACIWSIAMLRSCAANDEQPFWSQANRTRIARLYLDPITRAIILGGYGKDWRFPFDAFNERDPATLDALATNRGLREASATAWDALHDAGHLDDFNHRLLRRHALLNLGFTTETGRRPVILIDSTTWWHIFWSDGSTSTVVRPAGMMAD